MRSISLDLGGHTYALVAVSTDLPPDQRTDRVIATAWDTAYVLYDGVPDAAEIARICASGPQAGGRPLHRTRSGAEPCQQVRAPVCPCG